MTKLSIIVPVYNLENYVSRTLDSLLSIRFSHDYEIIVVNDGSTDASGEVIARYQEKTDKIRLFTIENGGVSNARNVGIHHAQGQYITFMDGDDTVDQDFYEKAVAELDRGGYDFVQGNFREIYEDHVVPHILAEQDMEITDRKQIMEGYLCPEHRCIYNCVWSKVYRGDIVRQVPFCPGRILAEDQEYNFDVICICSRVKLLRDMSVDYFRRGDSIVHTMNSKKALNKLGAFEHILEKNPYPELILSIEKDRLRVLQEAFFYLCREKDPRAREIQKEIRKLPIRELWPSLPPVVRKWTLLHIFAGPLYRWHLSAK